MSKVLVTGGAGYIGSHACKALARVGYTPVAYDNLIYGHEWAVKWGPFEHGDILDRARLDDVIRRHRPEAVMHFAAFAYVGESVTDPGKYYRNNVCGSLTLLQAMRDNGIEKIVFSSTCATYGFPTSLPITEDTAQRPITPYGSSKLMVEHILNDFEAAHEIRSTSLRYFNAAGADPDAEIGEDHTPETHLVPLVLQTALGNRPHVSVFGADYDTPDGTCIRDYVHVTDLAEAHVLALRRLESGAKSRHYNLSNGRGFSVKEVISASEIITGRSITTVNEGRRHGDPPCLVGDATRALHELGWAPRHKDLHIILHTAWDWMEKQRNTRVLTACGPRKADLSGIDPPVARKSNATLRNDRREKTA